MPSVKKEDRRDSEHDAICAWLADLIERGERPPELFQQVDAHKTAFDKMAARVCVLKVGKVIVEADLGKLGFADLIVPLMWSNVSSQMLIEVKSSRETFSAGDVIRQMKSYMRGGNFSLGGGVLVCNQYLPSSAKWLLKNEGFRWWEIDWQMGPLPSHTT